MDYTTQRLAFRIRKTLRYAGLYGIRRTLIKIKGQYHMKKRYAVLPTVASPIPDGGHIGLIGCGNFSFSNIAYYLKKNYGRVIRAAMDIDVNKAASLYEAYGLRYYTDDAQKLLDDPAIDLVYVASNHATHAEYAIQALRAGKNVHIEKPHVVREDQLERLCVAISETRGKANLGFNRPHSRIGQTIKQYLDAESGPAMFNWFIAGHEIAADHWYFKREEGGRVLGNLCHWTDFVLQLVPAECRHPIVITPTRGRKPDCDIAVTYVFGDESIAAITFSAKGHTFEGVRERFAAHRGNVLISMDDFKDLTVEVVQRKHRPFQRFRNHGHEECIKLSYEMVCRGGGKENPGCSLKYVWETGDLFLKTRKALEENQQVVVQPFDESRLAAADGIRPKT
jgi:predicted dehydrogenase